MQSKPVYYVSFSLLLIFHFVIVPFVVAYVLSLPFINANYIINSGELLFAMWLLQPSVMTWALSQWHTTFLFVYFQNVADYYYLLMGWSMKEVSIIDTELFWFLLLIVECIGFVIFAMRYRKSLRAFKARFLKKDNTPLAGTNSLIDPDSSLAELINYKSTPNTDEHPDKKTKVKNRKQTHNENKNYEKGKKKGKRRPNKTRFNLTSSQ